MATKLKNRGSQQILDLSHTTCALFLARSPWNNRENEKGKQMMYKTPTVMTHCLSADYAIILKCWEEVSEMKLKGSQSHSHGVVLKLSSSEIRYYL